jgi:dTDP-4-dehydrorhamnose reductase
LGGGFVGQAFGHYLTRSVLDYTDPFKFERLLIERKPTVVINCAGMTGRPNIDECESRRAETLQANLVLPANLSSICEDHGVTFVHMSSGCIYSGDKDGNGWLESDKPDPLSFYSETKALAEELVKGYIIRLRMPFSLSPSSRDFINKLMRYPKLISHDNSLTYLLDLVNATDALLEQKAPLGIYNVVNTGSVTHAEIVNVFREEGVKWAPEFIGDQEFTGMVKATRSNCVLNNKKIRRFYAMPDVVGRLRMAAQYHKLINRRVA